MLHTTRYTHTHTVDAVLHHDSGVCQVVDVACFLSLSGGVMIYFDRIEVVNYLIPSAGNSSSAQRAKNIKRSVYSPTYVCAHLETHLVAAQLNVFVCVFPPCSVRHREELHGRLRQSPDIQQGPPRAQPVLQCPLAAGGLHRPVW